MNDRLKEALERQLRKLRPDLLPPVPKKPQPPVVSDPDLQSVHLVFQEGTSDKEYLAKVVKAGSLYEVRFEYGRRGGTHQKGIKTDHPVSLTKANSIFNKLVDEKKKKGYKEI